MMLRTERKDRTLRTIKIEGQSWRLQDLRLDGYALPDPIWELHCPDGFHFADDPRHSIMGDTIKECRDWASIHRLAPCGPDCK
jgi:hypothetical protein